MRVCKANYSRFRGHGLLQCYFGDIASSFALYKQIDDGRSYSEHFHDEAYKCRPGNGFVNGTECIMINKRVVKFTIYIPMQKVGFVVDGGRCVRCIK